MKRLPAFIVTLSMALLACGNRPQQQTTGSTGSTGSTPTTYSLVGSWSGDIAPGTGFSGSSIPITYNFISNTAGTAYFTWGSSCNLTTDLTVTTGTDGQFVASNVSGSVQVSGTESVNGQSIMGRITFSLATCAPNGSTDVGGNFSVALQ